MFPHIITGGSCTLMIKGVPYTVDDSHPNYEAILDAIRDDDMEIIPELINRAQQVASYISESGSGELVVNVDAGEITYEGYPIHNSLVTRIFSMMEHGFDVTPLVNFLGNLMLNPSKRAVDELYTFLEYGKLPITEDGHFLAYKRVNANYTSVHDSRTDNSIGAFVSMPRNAVNEDSSETCSTGLHFCSHEYLKSFGGGRTVILKINPRDVVSIPKDYNNTKGRACLYQVIGELDDEQRDTSMHSEVLPQLVVELDDEYEPVESVLSRVISREQRDIDDYTEGYADGKRRINVEDIFEDASSAYREGYRDGRGHRPRKYKNV